jgi:hypothetical protein
MNPKNSPWNKPKNQLIQDFQLWARWKPIKKHLTTTARYQEWQGILEINEQFYIAKKTSKMRLKSHLDWCWYTPKTLAQAIDTGTVEEYYEFMLHDGRTDPNIWKDRDVELELKTYYAERAGRASTI